MNQYAKPSIIYIMIPVSQPFLKIGKSTKEIQALHRDHMQSFGSNMCLIFFQMILTDSQLNELEMKIHYTLHQLSYSHIGRELYKMEFYGKCKEIIGNMCSMMCNRQIIPIKYVHNINDMDWEPTC